jgi:hypothetical protein
MKNLLEDARECTYAGIFKMSEANVVKYEENVKRNEMLASLPLDIAEDSKTNDDDTDKDNDDVAIQLDVVENDNNDDDHANHVLDQHDPGHDDEPDAEQLTAPLVKCNDEEKKKIDEMEVEIEGELIVFKRSGLRHREIAEEGEGEGQSGSKRRRVDAF